MRSERKMKRTLLSSLFLGPALLLAALLAPGTVAAAGPITSTACVDGGTTVTCNLWAKPGSVTLPTTTGTVSVPVWGFAATAGGPAIVPGPVLVADQGDTVTVNLNNNLGVSTSILFGGQALAPDITGVIAGGTTSYTFVASAPGTYLYEAGLIPGSQYQVAMGLYGALIVRPAGLPGQAYGSAATAFNDEALVILGEIDPALNNSATPWTVDLRAFAPRYFLVNGAPYTSAAPSITTTPGAKLLLRYANAGIQHHSIGVLGLHQVVLAADGSQLPYPRTMVAETVAPGQSADVLVTMPATTAASTKYALYDASMTLNNTNASGIGGMLAFIDATGTAGADTVGPLTSNVALNTTSGLLTASVSETTTGNNNVAAAEYRIDTTGGSGTAMTGTFGSPNVSVTATIPAPVIAGLSSGSHTVYVRGRDSLSNWGAFSSVTFSLDKVGPTTSALVLNPNPSNGTVSVALTGTASDAATGNGNVTAAEYFVGAPGANGTGLTVARNATAATVSLSATIPAGPGGVISVHAQDAAGNWGPFATITRVVDGTGPTTSSIVANPAANNGSLGQSSSNPTVRVTASFSDVASGGSTIATGEGFIDNAAGANGTGFPFTATDGVFNATSESGFADIPLSTINLLSSGNHTIYVHGKDSVGNWGAKVSITYLIDRTAPTFASISLVAVNPTLAGTINLTVNGASDPLAAGLASGVAGGEYWIDTAAPTAGGGTPFSGLTAGIPTASLTTGSHTVGVRIRDVAGNWSAATHSATVSIVAVPIFSNGFDTGGAPWGWSSRSTNTTARLNATAASALVGARGLQAQGNNTNYVQFNFGTTGNPAWPTYDARFYFRPNGNISAGTDILSAATSSTFGTIDFRVRYRLNLGTPQVQIQVGTGNTNTTWTNILGGTSNNVIEVVWQATGSVGPNPGTLALHVNGVLAQTLTTASTSSVGAVRLGSVTNAGNATLMYFDAFASKRSVSPLVGP